MAGMKTFGMKIRRVVVEVGNASVRGETEADALQRLRAGGIEDFDCQGADLIMVEVVESAGEIDEEDGEV